WWWLLLLVVVGDDGRQWWLLLVVALVLVVCGGDGGGFQISPFTNGTSISSQPDFFFTDRYNVAKDEAYLDSVTEKRIKLFESIKIEQANQHQVIGGESIKITLPDHGNILKGGKKWVTTPDDIAKEIYTAKELKSKPILISEVNGSLWDMGRPFEGDCKLRLFTFDSDEGRDTFWHSSAHILGEALERQYGCKLCIGPCTTRGEGFYYDAFYGDLGLNEDHVKIIKNAAEKAVAEKQPFERIEVTKQQALEMFSEDNFKVEIIQELPEDKTITVYRCGPLVDLCRGPHIPNISFVKAFACLKASSAYWRGNKERESLQRVYGISYPDDKRLKVVTPNMYNMQLWETSGHAANYKENMFVFEIEKQEFGLKPMNCPGHCLMFGYRVRSYRELPLRLADFGVLHRNEASGALTGLTRVRRFQQDDAHIFCRESQIKDEVKGVLEFIRYTYDVFGFTFELELSTRPEKYLGEISTWDKAESALSEALNEFGRPWKINEGDGAFYGPKIDIGVFDALKRKFQCATLQLDFQLPCRFNLSYSAEDEALREKPVIIHRAILGSVERVYKLNSRLKDQIQKAGYYVDVDITDRKIDKKVSRRVRDKAELTVMSVEALLTFFKEEAAAVR
ncbi:hypothetical protein C5167_048052, partial [Papaver somniferum]